MQIYWVDGPKPKSLAIISRPREDRLKEEVDVLRREGVGIVVSLLTTQEQEELGLAGEASACEQAGIAYLNFPISDHGVPESPAEFSEFLYQLADAVGKGSAIGVHCFASIGRSSVLSAALLCMQGLDPESAFELLSQARGFRVPDTVEQSVWIEQFVRSPHFDRAK